MKRNWSKEEIEILRNKKAEGLGYSEIQKYLPHRSVDAINLKSSKLGISKKAEKRQDWSEEDIKVLHDKKTQGFSYPEIQKYLPHRSLSSLESKAGKLGLWKKGGVPWTKKEEIILKEKALESVANRDLVKFLPNRSWKAIEARLKLLGIVRQEEQKKAKKLRAKRMLLKRLREVEKKFKLHMDLTHFEDKSTPINYKCSKGHEDTKTYQYFYKSVHGCYKCGKLAQNKDKLITNNRIIAHAKKLNLKILLNNEYKNGRQPIEAECLKCGKKFQTNASRLVKKMGCQLCGWKRGGRKNAANQDEIKKALLKKNIELLSKYENNHSKIKVRYIDCGHEDSSNWALLKEGRTCGICAEAKKPTKIDFENCAKKFNGFILKTPNIPSNKAKWKCEYGHVFSRRLRDITKSKSFCPTCKQSWGEGVCRSVLEETFGVAFPKVRLSDMKSNKGHPLEFDCYNSELKIALEHNGLQHYESQKNWGGDPFFKVQKINDKIKVNYAKKNQIVLLTIPQLGSLTPLKKLTKEISLQLKNQGAVIPKRLSKININEIKIRTGRDFYIEKVRMSAKRAGFIILEKIEGSDQKIKVRCKKGHETYKTPRSITEGHACSTCRIEKISKPVKLSDGRKFKSRKEAGDALGVNKTRINKAVLNKKKVKGVFVYDI